MKRTSPVSDLSPVGALPRPVYPRAGSSSMLKPILPFALLAALAACSPQARSVMVVITTTPRVVVATREPTASSAPRATFTQVQPTLVLGIPTWREVVKFVEDDHTNWNQWDGTVYGGSYVCAEFAIDLADHAQAAGLKAGLVHVEWAGNYGGHAFVWFETADKGRMWIEPQTDYAYVRPNPQSVAAVSEGTKYVFPSRTILQDVRGYYWEPYIDEAIELDQQLTWSCRGAPTFLCETIDRPASGG